MCENPRKGDIPSQPGIPKPFEEPPTQPKPNNPEV